MVNAIEEAERAGKVKGLAVGVNLFVQVAISLAAGFLAGILKRVKRDQEVFGGGDLLAGFHMRVMGLRVGVGNGLAVLQDIGRVVLQPAEGSVSLIAGNAGLLKRLQGFRIQSFFVMEALRFVSGGVQIVKVLGGALQQGDQDFVGGFHIRYLVCGLGIS